MTRTHVPSMLPVTTREDTMSTHIQHPGEPHPDPSAQSLLMWLGAAMLVVTGLIIVAITTMSGMSAMLVAYGGLLVAVVVVFLYIMRFIGPEDH